MDIYAQLVVKIVEQQESVIGPVAIERAQTVKGLLIDWPAKNVVISESPMTVIDNLVNQYKVLFGQISVEVCKEAVGRLSQRLSPEQIPASLR